MAQYFGINKISFAQLFTTTFTVMRLHTSLSGVAGIMVQAQLGCNGGASTLP